jgi:tetratricopeptide (TPR) repeat protein
MSLLLIGMQVFSQPDKAKPMPVTTNSKSALSYYNQAMKYYDDVKVKEALETFIKALDQDKDFFMVNYQLAFYFFMNRDRNNFNKYADAAINCKTVLSDAEELLKEALTKLQQGSINIIDLGKKLVNLYPGDPNAYNNLVSFQSLARDSIGIIETLNKAIKIAAKPATFYNQLGYAYLTLNQSDKAEAAFDRYIELDPRNPNVYDSKGDYFMFMEKYYYAYELYMKANSMDKSFSREKADMARYLYERTEGKKLEIISL